MSPKRQKPLVFPSPPSLPHTEQSHFSFIQYIHTRHKTQHTQTHTHTIFRYLFQLWHRCPRLGGGVRPWELAPPGMGFLSSLACLLLPDSLQRADLATVNEPFPTREAWVPVILSILPGAPACQDSLLSHLPTAQQELFWIVQFQCIYFYFLFIYLFFAGFGKASNTRIRAETRIRKWLGKGDDLVSRASFILQACDFSKRRLICPQAGSGHQLDQG